MSLQDTIHMQRALSLAAQGKGRVSPNPCVGCVIVRGDEVVGEGYHPFFSGPHAEVVALRNAGIRAKGADVYLTLEPCTHFGKTPPCVPALIRAGVKKIVIAVQDPNPAVSGRGIRALTKAGIQVETGIEEDAAKNLTIAYRKWVKVGRPYVVLKAALTMDGKTATTKGDSKWISSPESRRLVHRFRTESDAILVGTRTARLDDPVLTSHGVGRNPLRVVLDPLLSLPVTLKMFRDKRAPTIVFCGKSASQNKRARLEKLGVRLETVRTSRSRVDLRSVLNVLGKMGVAQLLVEGGGTTAWSFVKDKLADELIYFIAPKLLGGSASRTPLDGAGFSSVKKAVSLHQVSVTRFGPDIFVRARFAKG